MNEIPHEELLTGYLDDELSASERAIVERMLRVNADARQLLEELSALRDSIRSLPRHQLCPPLAAPDFVQSVLKKAERELLSFPTPGSTDPQNVRGVPQSADEMYAHHGHPTNGSEPQPHATPGAAAPAATHASRDDAAQTQRSRMTNDGNGWKRLVAAAMVLAASVALLVIGPRNNHDPQLPVVWTPANPHVEDGARGLSHLERNGAEFFGAAASSEELPEAANVYGPKSETDRARLGNLRAAQQTRAIEAQTDIADFAKRDAVDDRHDVSGKAHPGSQLAVPGMGRGGAGRQPASSNASPARGQTAPAAARAPDSPSSNAGGFPRSPLTPQASAATEQAIAPSGDAAPSKLEPSPAGLPNMPSASPAYSGPVNAIAAEVRKQTREFDTFSGRPSGESMVVHLQVTERAWQQGKFLGYLARRQIAWHEGARDKSEPEEKSSSPIRDRAAGAAPQAPEGTREIPRKAAVGDAVTDVQLVYLQAAESQLQELLADLKSAADERQDVTSLSIASPKLLREQAAGAEHQLRRSRPEPNGGVGEYAATPQNLKNGIAQAKAQGEGKGEGAAREAGKTEATSAALAVDRVVELGLNDEIAPRHDPLATPVESLASGRQQAALFGIARQLRGDDRDFRRELQQTRDAKPAKNEKETAVGDNDAVNKSFSARAEALFIIQIVPDEPARK